MDEQEIRDFIGSDGNASLPPRIISRFSLNGPYEPPVDNPRERITLKRWRGPVDPRFNLVGNIDEKKEEEEEEEGVEYDRWKKEQAKWWGEDKAEKIPPAPTLGSGGDVFIFPPSEESEKAKLPKKQKGGRKAMAPVRKGSGQIRVMDFFDEGGPELREPTKRHGPELFTPPKTKSKKSDAKSRGKRAVTNKNVTAKGKEKLDPEILLFSLVPMIEAADRARKLGDFEEYKRLKAGIADIKEFLRDSYGI